MSSRNVLKRDFGIFAEPGFLVTLAIVGLIGGIGAWILIHFDNTYGIPIAPYWKSYWTDWKSY